MGAAETIGIIMIILIIILMGKALKTMFGIAGSVFDTISSLFQGSKRNTSWDARWDNRELPNAYWDNPYYSPAKVMPKHLRDPKRSFDRNDFHFAARQAGYQCEYVDPMGYRCGGRGELHADHWFPHSRGGATQYNPQDELNPFTNNLVILCADCNMAKSNNSPLQEETMRLEHLRSTYGSYSQW